MRNSSLRLCIATACILLFCAGIGWASNEEQSNAAKAQEVWQSTARKVLEQASQMDQRSSTAERFAKMDEQELRAEIARLHAAVTEKNAELASINQELNEVSAQRAALGDKYQAEMADMKTVEGSFRTALRQSLVRFDLSPVAVMRKDKVDGLKQLLEGEEFLGLSQMQAYTNYLFEDMKATAVHEKARIAVVTPKGEVEEVELVRAGAFFLGYQDKENTAFVLPQAGSYPLAITANKADKKALASWLSAEGDSLAIDITGGAAIRATEHEQGLDDWVEAGGVLLYPILIAGVIGLLCTLFKTVHLLGQSRLGIKKREGILALIEKGDGVESIHQKLKAMSRCPSARVMEAGLHFAGAGIDSLDNRVEEKIMEQEARLNRYLSIIAILASIAPLLGLLGTVTGMINTFHAITIFGTSDPRMMSTGISEALVTTQAGLGIAIPLLLAHHFLRRRVGMLVGDMETSATALVAQLCRR